MPAYQSEYDGNYYDDPSQEAAKQNPQPDTSAPQFQAAPAAPAANPRASSSVDYGNGITGKKGADGLWYYPWRSQGYQDLLGDNEVNGTLQENKYRDARTAAGLKTDATSANVATSADFQNFLKTGAVNAGQSYPQFQNPDPSFTDPSQKLVEDYSLDRFRHLQNPDPNSGQGMFENYLRSLVETLKGPVYSAGDESVIKGQAFDSINKERDATRQRWMEEVSRRGLAPSSGPALDGLRKIDEHFDGAMTTVNAQFAKDAIQQTRDQRFQVGDQLAKLAGTEEDRQARAGTYAGVPLQLSDQAFQRNLQLVGAGGNPAQQLQSALSVYQAITGNDRLDSQARQQGLQSIFQYLAGLV